MKIRSSKISSTDTMDNLYGCVRQRSISSIPIFPLYTEGGKRKNRLHLESRTPSWAGLWTLSYMPSIYRNNIPTGKPDPPDGRAPGLVPRLSIA